MDMRNNRTENIPLIRNDDYLWMVLVSLDLKYRGWKACSGSIAMTVRLWYFRGYPARTMDIVFTTDETVSVFAATTRCV